MYLRAITHCLMCTHRDENKTLILSKPSYNSIIILIILKDFKAQIPLLQYCSYLLLTYKWNSRKPTDNFIILYL